MKLPVWHVPSLERASLRASCKRRKCARSHAPPPCRACVVASKRLHRSTPSRSTPTLAHPCLPSHGLRRCYRAVLLSVPDGNTVGQTGYSQSETLGSQVSRPSTFDEFSNLVSSIRGSLTSILGRRSIDPRRAFDRPSAGIGRPSAGIGRPSADERRARVELESAARTPRSIYPRRRRERVPHTARMASVRHAHDMRGRP